MCKSEVRTKAIKMMTFIAVFAFLIFQSGTVFGGAWNNSGMEADGERTIPFSAGDGSGAGSYQTSDLQSEIADDIAAATSSETKLFWIDCGFNNDCSNASLWYVDPGVAPLVKTQFATGVLVDPYNCSILTGTVDLGTYHVTNKKIGYVAYAKSGKLWLVDTTTLVKSQMSSEAGFTPGTVCSLSTLIDWKTPANTTLFYSLAGPDAACSTGDDVGKAVKGSMTAADAPINTGTREFVKLLFDGTYVAFNYSTSPYRIIICQPDLTTCSLIGTFTSSAAVNNYDATRFILRVDGKLMLYNYVTKEAMKTLYTPLVNEKLSKQRLDRDGFVYFSTYTTVVPYTYSLKKVAIGGGAATTLATFTTSSLVSEDLWWFDLTPSYMVYSYPNTSLTGMIIYSVPKAGGAPVLLTNSAVDSGGVGDYLIFEDSAGKVTRKNLLDGAGVITKANSQLNGYTKGGAGDWYYDFDPSTFRIYLSGIDNKLKSYGLGEDFTDPAVGVLVGTLPVNLSNLDIKSGLAKAKKRNKDFSFGTDILYIKGTVASSLTRLTNTNGEKHLLNHQEQ
jgi:hypothetical protein